MSDGGNDQAVFKGLGAGLVASVGLGLAAGLVAAIGFWPWPATDAMALGSAGSFFSMVLSGLVIGGAIGLLIGGTLAWQGSGVGATLDRGDAAPIYGILAGIVLGGSLSPLVGAVLGLLFGQLLGGALLGLVLGPIVGVLAWEIGYWTADYYRGMSRSH